MESSRYSMETVLAALRDLVEAIKRGEDVSVSHWAYLRAEALVEE